MNIGNIVSFVKLITFAPGLSPQKTKDGWRDLCIDFDDSDLR